MAHMTTLAVSELARLLQEQPAGGLGTQDEWSRFVHFLSLAEGEGFDLNPAVAVVFDADRLCWACAAVRSSGRSSMLVMAPLPDDVDDVGPALAEAVRTIVVIERRRDVSLVQALLPPEQASEGRLLLSCGFVRLAELIYLQGDLPTLSNVAEPPGLGVRRFSPDLEPVFAEVIKASYVKTLDCPGLEGRRRMQDVLAGHRGSGVFRPDMWFLYSRANEPIGVVLLNEVADRSHRAVELVYMGLVLSARGQGLGRTMFIHAMACARRNGYRRIITAVDAANEPALRLYCGQGLVESTRRIAYVNSVM